MIWITRKDDGYIKLLWDAMSFAHDEIEVVVKCERRNTKFFHDRYMITV